MDASLERAATIIFESNLTNALTGAGISVESGIPDFRSESGLWARYDPGEYATIDAFRSNPEKVWRMLGEMEELLENAKPNKAHTGLGELEKMGYLKAIVTQNIDNLHQAGGATNVIEYHGNANSLSCLSCGNSYDANEIAGEIPPRCRCDSILKPDVIFFGEAIPVDAMNRSFLLASTAQAVLVVGTSALVSPANTLPGIAKQNGAKIIEINVETTHLTDSLSDVFLQDRAGEVIWDLVSAVKDLASQE